MASKSVVKAYVATEKGAIPIPGTVERRAVGPNDVLIDILYCGICHTDLHFIRGDFPNGSFPMIAGHEIAGVVEQIGSKVTKFKVGQHVGVGCIVDSCKTCKRCETGFENKCVERFTMTYASDDKISGGKTFGGYSEKVVVLERYVIAIPDNLDLAKAAPLLCAGITTFSPLIDSNIGPGSKVGLIGIGGLGHVGIKLARALGAEVVAFTSREEKKAEILELGANEVVVTSNPENFAKHTKTLDIIIDTVSAEHPTDSYIYTLKPDGTYILVGAPAKLVVPVFPLLMGGIVVRGSGIGGIKRTQELLDLCGKTGVTAEVELADLNDLKNVYDRLDRADVRFRFVLDIKKSFKNLNAEGGPAVTLP